MNKSTIKEQKKERIGKFKTSNEGYEMIIVEYNDAKNIIVKFQDEYGAKVHTTYQHFEKGNVKNPFHKSVYGVGYYGQGKFKSRENGKKTRAYQEWVMMMMRVYDPYELNKHPTYIDCFVCEEWHNFQNFAKWYYKNYYEIKGDWMCLDKDILVKGNKIYSPETCVLVPNRINVLFVKRQNYRGEYLIGVTWHKRDNIYEAKCNYLDGEGRVNRKYLGRFNSEFQAFYCYKTFKENYIKQVADEYYSKGLIPKKLYDALYKYEVEIND